MKFSQMPYARPDIQDLKQKMNDLTSALRIADTLEEQNKIIAEVYSAVEDYYTEHTLASIRQSIDTNDEFYKHEKEFLDEMEPVVEEYITDYYKVLTESKFRKELAERWGNRIFELAEIKMKTFQPNIIEDLQLENKLTTEYADLLASAQIPFDGKELTITQLQTYEESTDRNIRKQASEARFQFFADHEGQLDRIYDDLVKVRTRIATKLGYDSFTSLAYDRMQRTDYNEEMVSVFRKQVLEHIVPLVSKLKDRQRRRIGLEKLEYYDDPFRFTSGNANPIGTPEEILEAGTRMYAELSPETDEFYTFMQENELLDVLSRKGKQFGGYCTHIFRYKAPFIFANFNGTSGDIEVLTHEAGHAFQAYESRNIEVPECIFPGSESAEIHSMSMEFFTWPWMDQFFGDNADKFKYSHMEQNLAMVPYICLVDHFQHYVYGNPEATPDERKQEWRRLEKLYTPWKSFADNDYLERGGLWQRQQHIYRFPFYYIDYGLADICALQFWKRMHEDWDAAWADYLKLCKLGGTLPFTGLVKEAGLISPFEDNCVASIIKEIENWMDSIDDTKY